MSRTIITSVIVFIFTLACQKQENPQNNSNRIDGLTRTTPNGGILLPAQDGPIRDVFEPPAIRLETFQLKIDGLVKSPQTFSWDQILKRQSVQTDTMIMYCVEGWEVWGQWKGLAIKDLLDTAVPEENATHVLFWGIDGYSTAMPIAYLLKYKTMLAYEVNGQPLKKRDGYPLRLVAFGLFGYKWAKYVTRLELINGPQLGYWESYGYDDKALVPLSRRKFYEGANAQPIDY